MMRSLIASSVKARLLVIALAAAIMSVGAVELRRMPVDVLPEFNAPYVEIQTEALGLSAGEVEQIVTIALEDLLNGVAWLDVIRSQSVPGLSSVELVFEPGTDVMRARQLVQERLTQATLPNVARQPAMLQPLSSSSRFMMIGLSSKELSGIDLSVLSRWTVRPRLMGVPGVANVAVWGQRERQLQVQVDPKRLQAQGVSLQQVLATTGNALWVSSLSFVEASTPGTGGFIDTPNQRLGVQHVSPIVTPADLSRVTVEDTPGKSMRLGDVASVVEDHQPLIGDAVLKDGQGILLVVEKLPGANTLDVTRGVEEALTALRPGMSGVDVDSQLFRPASFLESAVDNVALALLLGGLLVLLLFVVFSWRTAVVALVVVPLSLIAAALVLRWTGSTMNAMVLAGLLLALAAVLDDVVVGTHAAAARLRAVRSAGPGRDAGQAGDAAPSPASVLVAAAGGVSGPLLFATAALLLSVVPLFFLPGAAGTLLPPLARSYVLALLASMLVALTLTPALSLVLGVGPRGPREAPVARWLQARHAALLGRILAARRPVLVAAGLLAAFTVAALPALAQPAMPSFQERNLLLTFDGTPGTARPEMNRIAAAAVGELRSVPGVSNVGAHVGRAVLSDEVGGINAGQIWVSIADDADYDAAVSDIQEIVDGYPGLEREVQTYSDERIREVFAGTDDPVAVRLYGPELAPLRGKAEEVRQAMAGVDGLVDARVDVEPDEPQLEVEVNLEAAQKQGLKPGDVRRAAATLMQGIEVGSLFEQQKVFEVVVRGMPGLGNSITSVGDLMLDKPGGGQVRLADVAAVRVAPTASVMEREAVSARVDVTAGVSGRSRADVAADVERRLQALSFPLEYRAEVLQDAAQRQSDANRLGAIALAVAIGVLLLLQAAYRSWSLAALTFLTLPAALSGGVLAALLGGGGELTVSALAGLLAVLTVAVRSGVLLVRRFQELERAGEAPGPDLVLRGTRERVVPILLSALAVGLAFAPVVLLGERPGYEVLRPLAGTVLGGLVTATLVTLFVVPAAYLATASRRRPVPADGPADDPDEALVPSLG